MVRKLFAVVVAATLMAAGTAWGATNYVYGSGGWTPSSPTGTVAADSGKTSIGSTNGAITVSTPITAVTLDASSHADGADELNIGYTASGTVAVGGTVDVTVTTLSITASNNKGKANVAAGNTLRVTTLTMGDSADDIINNAGNLYLGTMTIGAAAKIANTGTIYTTTAGIATTNFITALKAGNSDNIGTIEATGALGTQLASISGATGTIRLKEAQTGNNQTVNIGTLNLELSGGDFSGAMTAAKVTAIAGENEFKNTVTAALDVAGGATAKFSGSGALASGKAVNVAATGKLVVGTDLDWNASAITNAGTIEVAQNFDFTVKGYSGSGAIKNLNAGGGSDAIVIAASATADNINAVMTSLVAGNNGNIGNVKITDALGANLTVDADAGQINLGTTAQATAYSVTIGGADLAVNANGANKFNNVTAGTIKTVANAATEFNGIVTANLDVAANATFKGNSEFSGGMKVADSSTVTVESGSEVTIAEGKALIIGDTASTLTNTGGTLTIAASNITIGTSGSINITDSATNATSETNLNSNAAAALLTNAKFSVSTGFGTINVRGDIGNAAGVNLSAGVGTVNIHGNQTQNTNAMNFTGSTVNLLGGESAYTGGFTAAAINIGGSSTGTPQAATAAFGGALTGAVKVYSGSTMKIKTAATANSGITLDANSTLHVDNTLTMGTTKTLAIASSAKLSAGDNVTTAVTGFSGVGDIKLDGNAATETTLTTYLDKLAVDGLTRTTNFTWDNDANEILYSFTATPNTPEALTEKMTTVLDDTKSGFMASGLTASAVTAWADIITAATPIDDRGDATKALLDAYFNPVAGAMPSAAAMQSVVSTLAGFDSAKSLDIAMVTANNVAGRIQSRVADNNLARAQTDLGSTDALASAMLNGSFANRFWVGGFGVWENADRSGWDNGYEYKSGGFITGYDRVFGPVTVGGSFAYTAGSYEDKNALSSDSSIDSYAFNLYATYNHCSGFFATILGGYTYSDYDMSNVLAGGVEKSAFHADTWTVGGTVGYDIRPIQNLTITPSIGLYYYTSKSNTYNSTMKNGLKVEQDSAEMPIDLAASYDIPVSCGNIRLTANTGYAYRFGNAGGNLNDFGYNGITGVRVEGIEGRENPRHTWNVGAGVSYSTGRFDIGVKYDYYLKKNYDAHRVLGTVGISF